MKTRDTSQAPGLKTLPSLTNFRVLALSLGIAGLLFLLVAALPASAQAPEVQVLVAKAILAYDDKRFADALNLLQEALRLEPDNIEALYYTGLTYLGMKDPSRATEVLEKARAKSPTDLMIRYQLGVAYFTLDQYDKAEPLLTEVFREQPQLDNLGYYVGFMRYRNKDYQGALRAFTTGTATDPNLRQLTRFYAGLSMAIIGLPEQAVAEVDEALRIEPSSPLTGPAERLRDNMVAARTREQRLHADLRFGGFYDTNVAVNPRHSSDALAEQLRQRQSRSPGELANLRLDYAWFRNGPWESTAGYSFFQTINNKLPFFNLQDHLGNLGLTYKGAVNSMPYLLGTTYSYDFLTLNDAAFLQRHTGTVSGTLVENPGNLTTVFARIQSKDFIGDALVLSAAPQENRDAVNDLGGVFHVFRFEGDKHFLRLGYQFDREWAKGSNYTYSGHRILAGGQWTVPYTLAWGPPRVRYDYEVHLRDYSNINTILPSANPGTVQRRDTEQLHDFRVEQPLPRDLLLTLEFQAMLDRSNLAVFSYDRQVVSLILSWSY